MFLTDPTSAQLFTFADDDARRRHLFRFFVEIDCVVHRAGDNEAGLFQRDFKLRAVSR
jgi:hypothetical protein